MTADRTRWGASGAAVGATGAVLLLAAILLASLPGVAAAALRPVTVKHSLLGTHQWYVQTHRGLDVVGGFFARHEYRDGRTETVEGRLLVRGEIADRPSVSRRDAAVIARRAARADRTAAEPALAILSGDPARLVWSVVVERPTGRERVLVDARTGDVREVRRLAVNATGSGRGFDPNPVVTLRDPSLTDEDDADHPALAGAYRDLELTHLDGSGFLRGDYARIALRDEDAAFSAELSFPYDRSSAFFEQVMAYYHVTRSQEYIQDLGFTALNTEPQALLPNLIPDDVSFFDPSADVMVFGTGGIDDAEDADIIWHEYGHAMQYDQFLLAGEPSQDAGAIGEGFGDYWAVTMSQPVNDGYDVPCMGDWDFASAGSLPRCLRRVDEDLTVADRTGQVHHDGGIWSRALWDINQELGRDVANRIVLEAQYAYSPTTSFSEAAAVTVSTAERLYDRSAAKVVREAFARRGIRAREHPEHPERPEHPEHPPPTLPADVVAAIGDPAPGGGALHGTFEPGGLNADGIASFNADLLVDGDVIGEGAFVGAGSPLSELARSGGAAPGGGTFGAGTIGPVALNDGGDVAFGFALDPLGEPFGVNSGLYRRPAPDGALRAVVVPDQTPAPGGGVFRGAFESAINAGSQVAFTAITDTADGYLPDLGSGVYVAGPDGAPSTVTAPGDPAPGGGTFDFAGGPSINASGDVAFAAHVAGDEAFCDEGFLDCDAGVYLRRASGDIEAVARQGSPAPGFEGSAFLFAREPVVNDGGDVAFFALTTPFFDEALFLRRAGTTQLVARTFQELPGIGTVIIPFPSFRGLVPDYALNKRRQVAFRAFAFDRDLRRFVAVVLMWDAGKFRLLARPGTLVPGLGTIARIFSGILLNDRGQVLLQAQLEDGRRMLLRSR